MRRRDWLPRMWAELRMAEQNEFEFGKFDCVRLAARVVDAMVIDSNILHVVDTIYTDKRSALRLIMRSGGLANLVTMYMGQPGPRARARQGDVVSIDLPSGPAIGICTGRSVAIAAAPRGVAFYPLESVDMSWMVD